MLLDPEDGEQFRDPDADRTQPMQPRVAAGANCNQEARLAQSRPAVMNVEFRVPCPAARASIVVAEEDDFRLSAK